MSLASTSDLFETMLKTILSTTIALLLVFYPLLMYAGLHYLSPRWIAAGLLLLFSLRLYALRQHINATRVKEFVPIFVGVSITSLLVLFLNHDFFLRLNPLLINLNFLVVFGYTLWHPPSMIERFARLEHPDLPPQGIIYTRQVTKVWCGFFVLNGTIACWTAFQSLALWTLYNGLISYILMGLLFGAELITRHIHQRAHPPATPAHQEQQTTHASPP